MTLRGEQTGPSPATAQSGATQHPLDRYATPSPAADTGKEQSPFYKSAAPQITLPKGGGALKGIDEKLNVNAVNGTAGIDIALPLSPGRDGFTPAVSLSYNSGSGNSEFGLGWNLGLPSIQRKSEGRLPRYNDAGESDVFLLAGAEDLTPYVFEAGETPPTATGYTIKRYRPRIEGLFARIEFIKKDNTPDSWWQVTTKENLTTYYGLTSDARITDPEHAYRILKWLPQLTLDNKGNAQLYEYKAEDLANVPDALHERNRKNGLQPIANTYLKRVSYCNHTPFFIAATDVYEPSLPLSPTIDPTVWHMQAVWDYGDVPDIYDPAPPAAGNWSCRKDPFSDHRAGFEIRTYRLCQRVLMYHTFAELRGGAPTLVRSLELEYQNAQAAEAFVETDFIVKASQKGYDELGQFRALPEMQFGYHPFVWNTERQSVAPEDFQNAPQGLTGPYQWIDLEGEGLPGILCEHGQGWFYKHNLGDGHFTPAKSVAAKPSFTGLASGVLQWEDLEGNGERQLVSRAQGAEGFWQAKGPFPTTETETQLDWEPFRPFPRNLNIDRRSPHTLSLDLNGDGKADTLIADDRVFTWYENPGKVGYDEGGYAPGMAKDEEGGPQLILRDTVQSVFLADMSGDGLTDLVRIRNGEVCYWPNLGYGKFGAKVAMSFAPHFTEPDAYNPLYLTLADISGTGVADLIYIGEGKVKAWINYSGNAFSPAYDIGLLPSTDAYSKVAVLDFLGKGTACIVWSSPLPHYAHAPLQYIDLMGGKKPYILHRYANGLGKETSLTYKSSTHYYLADKKAGQPWATRLPFPVQCVEQVTTTDTVSETSYSQSYSYHHGYYDHEEREFRGFGRVDVIDTDSATVTPSFGGGQGEALDQAPVLTKSWYHTGAFRREVTLLDAYREEYFQFAGWDDAPTGEDVVQFPTGLSPLELREAHRALKGSPLRQEVYALDGTAQQSIPYTVTASAYEVKKIQGLPPGYSRDGNRKEAVKRAVFLNIPQQQIVFSGERDVTDVRIQHELTLETDKYGNVLRQVQVAYPRHFSDPVPTPPSSLPQTVQQEQAKMHLSYTETAYSNDVKTNTAYRLRLPVATAQYEVKNVAVPATGTLWTPAALGGISTNTTPVVDFGGSPLNDVYLRRLSCQRTLYLGDDGATIVTLGQIESLALPYEQYALAFTPQTLDACYRETPSAPLLVTPQLLQDGGYRENSAITSFPTSDTVVGWWLSSGHAVYNAPDTRFYKPEGFTDPWGNTTTITYAGGYYLMPETVIAPSTNIDPVNFPGNTTTVQAYDWRVLQPTLIRDPNDNLTAVRYDALGMPVAGAVMGKGSEGDYLEYDSTGPNPDSPLAPDEAQDIALQAAFLADPTLAPQLLGKATWRCVYDWSNLPVRVATIARERHYEDAQQAGITSPVLVRFTYADGFGRTAMLKTQAADDPNTGAARWIGSGKTVYNNKGKPVLQYEPYFSPTHDYDPALQAASLSVSAKLYYDPLGRLCRTELPDGTETRTEWDAWSQTIFDAVDTAAGSRWDSDRTGSGPLAGDLDEQDARAKTLELAGTPTVIHTDTLGRPFYTVQWNKTLDSNDVWVNGLSIQSWEELDILGNRLAVHDALGRTPLAYRYSYLQIAGFTHSIDSGVSRMLPDVAGAPLWGHDGADTETHMTYDALRRPTAKDVTPVGGTPLRVEEIAYGEDAPNTNDKVDNLRGQVLAHYDGGGETVFVRYSFDGLPVKPGQRILADGKLSDVDWSTSPALEATGFTTELTADALGRPRISIDPGGNETYHFYGKDGGLNRVEVRNAVAGTQQAYLRGVTRDAKGRRESVLYGNGTKTSYTYDPESQRLRRILTEKTTNTGTNVTLQDLRYFYDAGGNITCIRDEAAEVIFSSNTKIVARQDFSYDSLYRLVKAMGRERISASVTGVGPEDNWYDKGQIHVQHPGSSSDIQNYIQRYEYDAVGNIKKLKHAAAQGSFTRDYVYGFGNNKLATTQVGSRVYTYGHDAVGNMQVMPHLQGMDYDLQSQMVVCTQGTVRGFYQYGSGQRMRKVVYKPGGIREERLYFGSYELYRSYQGTTQTGERQTVHVMDETGRIAMLETEAPAFGGDDLTRYIYSNHLQSATLELDDSGNIISYEEYHPYGTTSYQATDSGIRATAKRYRFTGKERDEESGLYYHGARYYAPWLGRWMAVDPLESEYAPWSSYCYGFNDPVGYNDPTGMAAVASTENKKPVQNVVGYTVRTVILDKEGNPLPEGTKLPYSESYTNTDLKEQRENLGKGEVQAGTVVQPAQGEGGMKTVTLTYRMGWGEKEGKPLLWGYENAFTPYEEPKTEPEPNASVVPDIPVDRTGSVKTTPQLRDVTPVPTVTHVKSRPHPHPVLTPVRPLPAPPAHIIALQDSHSIATFRNNLTQESFIAVDSIGKQLSRTNVGSVNLTYNIGTNIMSQWSLVDQGGYNSVNPRTGRNTSHNPMKLVPVNNSGTHLNNIMSQMQEFRSILQHRLRIPVNLQFNFNTSRTFMDIRTVPKR